VLRALSLGCLPAFSRRPLAGLAAQQVHSHNRRFLESGSRLVACATRQVPFRRLCKTFRAAKPLRNLSYQHRIGLRPHQRPRYPKAEEGFWPLGYFHTLPDRHLRFD